MDSSNSSQKGTRDKDTSETSSTISQVFNKTNSSTKGMVKDIINFKKEDNNEYLDISNYWEINYRNLLNGIIKLQNSFVLPSEASAG
jgi:hypothetical protein